MFYRKRECSSKGFEMSNNSMGLDITEFKIDAVMATMPVEWRYRWCETKLCCCLGCCNRGPDGLIEQGFTKGDWLWWVARHPQEDVT